jgi:Na+/proline symporter
LLALEKNPSVKFTNTVDYEAVDVRKVTLTFIVLTIMLFSGIFLMMQPGKFGVTTLAENDETTLKSIVRMGAYFVVIGLVGLAVLGFIISSPRNTDEARKGTKEKNKQNQSQNNSS